MLEARQVIVSRAKKVKWGTLLCSEESVNAVQTVPTENQQRVLDSYCETYEELMGFKPSGLHYLPHIGGVWIPAQEDLPLH
jgi:hypothetical protein